MELAEFAKRVLLSETLSEKLASPEGDWTDAESGEAVRYEQPARPFNLQFAARREAPAMPKLSSLADPHKRAVAHHIMANHELQALEVMAWTLLAFPEAPLEFRTGLADIMLDEQRHTRMHAERSRKLGIEFGALPVNCYIWKKSQDFTDLLDYLSGLPLVFEGANLDHTMEFAEAFDQVGDTRSAALMRIIHDDEIEHVRFGITWLRTFKPAHQSDFECFQEHLHFPLHPRKAKGDRVQIEARRLAGLTDDFIEHVLAAGDRKASSRGHKQD